MTANGGAWKCLAVASRANWRDWSEGIGMPTMVSNLLFLPLTLPRVHYYYAYADASLWKNIVADLTHFPSLPSKLPWRYTAGCRAVFGRLVGWWFHKWCCMLPNSANNWWQRRSRCVRWRANLCWWWLIYFVHHHFNQGWSAAWLSVPLLLYTWKGDDRSKTFQRHPVFSRFPIVVGSNYSPWNLPVCMEPKLKWQPKILAGILKT